MQFLFFAVLVYCCCHSVPVSLPGGQQRGLPRCRAQGGVDEGLQQTFEVRTGHADISARTARPIRAEITAGIPVVPLLFPTSADENMTHGYVLHYASQQQLTIQSPTAVIAAISVQSLADSRLALIQRRAIA